MPVKSTASTATKTTTRRRRSSAKTPKVTTTQKTVVNTVQKTIKRPDAQLISKDAYLNDIKNRWNIHQYEIKELVKDLQTVVDFFKPYHARVVKLINN